MIQHSQIAVIGGRRRFSQGHGLQIKLFRGFKFSPLSVNVSQVEVEIGFVRKMFQGVMGMRLSLFKVLLLVS